MLACPRRTIAAPRLFALAALGAALLLLAAPPRIARADGEPAQWIGQALRPVDSDTIRMVRERVLVDLSPNTARVNATFVFRNEGPACDQIVAFPAAVAWASDIRDFRAWVDGREADVARHTSPFDDLFHWTVSFPAGAERTVRVGYRTRRDAHLEGAIAETGFRYILVTGRRWKGPIGSAEIILNLTDIQHHQVLDLQPTGYTRTRTGYRWLLRDIEPDQDVYVRFRTTPLEVVARSAGGDGWGYWGHPPILRGNTALISARFLRSAGRFNSEWDNSTKTFTARRGLLAVRCRAGSREAYLGDRKVTLQAAPEVRDGELLVPLGLAEPLGMRALYKPHTRQLFLRQNLLNWDAGVEPEHADLHLAPRRYLLSEYEADQRALERALRSPSGPARADALFKLADLAYYRGDWTTAQARYADAPQLSPHHRWARWWQAKAVQHQGRYGDALRLFAAQAAALGEGPEAPRDYCALAGYEAVLCVTKYRRGQRVEPEELALAAAAARRGEEAASGVQLARLRREMIPLLAAAGEHEEMLAVAERLLDGGDLADPDFRELLGQLASESRELGYLMAERLRGTDLEERFLRPTADAEFALRNYEQAARVYRRLVRDFPESERRGSDIVYVATASRKVGGDDAFRATCWELITTYPESAGLAAEHFAGDATEEQLRWMVEHMPHPPAAVLLRIADREYLLENYEKAFELYRAAGTGGDLREAGRWNATLMGALCQLQVGDTEAAGAAFDYLEVHGQRTYGDIMAGGPESVAAYVLIASHYSGYRGAQDTSRAILERGIARHPESALLRDALAGFYWRRWERERGAAQAPPRELLLNAVEEWEAAFRLDPNVQDAYTKFPEYRLAVSKAYCELAREERDAQAKRGYYEKAIARWKAIAGLRPEDSIEAVTLPDFLDAARHYLSSAQ